MEIINATAGLAESYCEAVDEVAREGKWLSVDRGFSLADSISFMKYCLRNGYVQLFLTDGDVVAGWCDVVATFKPGEGSLGIGIREAYRGQGFGSRLLDAAIQAAEKRFFRLALYVREDNLRAVHMYEKRGFKTKKRFKPNTYKNVDATVLMMVKNLKKKV